MYLVYGVSGAWGALATGIFAAPFINSLGTGTLYGNPGQILTQLIAVVIVSVYTYHYHYNSESYWYDNRTQSGR